MKDLARAVEQASRRAGAEILRWYGSGTLHTEWKADNSPVTSADKASHEVLMKALAQLSPGVPVVSEESGLSEAENLALIAAADEFWLVDPLDGTKDFLARSGEFCVCVALVSKGRPLLGVIHGPVTGESYVADDASVAKIDRGGGRIPMRCRPLGPAPVFLISRQHPGGEADRLRRAFPKATAEPLGSALKYARVAEGKADATVRFTPTSLWDLAAGQAILERAGGGLRALSGAGSLVYGPSTLVHPPFVAVGDSAMLDRVADQLMHAFD